MNNIRTVTSVREIALKVLFLPQKRRIIAENARPLSLVAVSADR